MFKQLFQETIWGRVKIQLIQLSQELSAKKMLILIRDHHKTHNQMQSINFSSIDENGEISIQNHTINENHAHYDIDQETYPEKNEAEKILWNEKAINDLLPETSSNVAASLMGELSYNTLITHLRGNLGNDDVFRRVAGRAEPILNEFKWSAQSNSCEHLANYLLTGRHWSRQLAEAGFFKLLLLHMVSPLLESTSLSKLLLLVAHVFAILLSGIWSEKTQFALYVALIYLAEYFPAAWVIAGRITLEAQGRNTRSTVLVLKVKI